MKITRSSSSIIWTLLTSNITHARFQGMKNETPWAVYHFYRTYHKGSFSRRKKRPLETLFKSGRETRVKKDLLVKERNALRRYYLSQAKVVREKEHFGKVLLKNTFQKPWLNRRKMKESLLKYQFPESPTHASTFKLPWRLVFLLRYEGTRRKMSLRMFLVRPRESKEQSGVRDVRGQRREW